MLDISRRRTGWLALSALLVTACLLYASFRSPGLDDFDAFSFALALDHFDLALQQPQPPGFPVYVVAGRLLHHLLNDPQLALTLLSVLSGALSLGLVVGCGAALGQRRAGWLAAVLLLVTPGLWLNSLVALSDVPGLAASLLVLWLLLQAATGSRPQARRDLVLGSLATGLMLGVRPQNALPVGLVGLWALAHYWPPTRWRSVWLGSGLAFLAGLGLWLIPTAQAVGGLDAYLDILNQHSAHVRQADSIFGPGLSAETLAARWTAFKDGWLWLIGGQTGWLPLIGLLAVAGLARVRWRSRLALFCTGWLALEGLKVFLFVSLERPRLYLMLLPPLALLIAAGWTAWRPRWLRAGGALLAGLLLVQSVGPAHTLHATPSAPEQATAFIARHYPADDSLLVVQGSFRATQYHLPAYPQLFTYQYNPATWPQMVAQRRPAYLVLVDRDDIPAAIYTAVTAAPDGPRYVPIADRTFQRDPAAFPQHVTVRVQVLIPEDQLQPAQVTLPPDGRIRPGSAEDGRFFGDGWYRAEDIGGVAARWAAERAVLRVALPPETQVLRFTATPFPDEQTVTVIVNGQVIETVPLRGVWKTYQVTIPAAALAGHSISLIELQHATSAPPGADARPLAVAYSQLVFSAGAAP